MRYQDRLLALLPAPSPRSACFLARELESLSPSFDAHRVLAALRELAASSDAEVALQGAASLQRYHSVALRKRYCPEVGPLGSRLAQKPAATVSDTGTDAARRDALEARREPMVRGLTHLLDPVVRRLVDMVPRLQQQAQQRVLLSLARIPHGAAADAAGALLSGDAAGGEAGAALLVTAVHCRAGKEGELLWRTRALASGPLRSAVVAALGLAPFEPVLDSLEKLAETAEPEVRPSLAVAAAGFPGQRGLALLRRLSVGGNGWTLLAVLQGLAGFADERCLEAIEQLHAASRHPSVRDAAVRAAAGVPGQAATQFVVRLLARRPPATVAARALQALQIRQVEPGLVARLARPYLDDEDLEVQVGAVLSLLAVEDPGASGTLKRWLRSGEPQLRAQGAYCLAYHQGRASVQLLSHLAVRDPEPLVRRQALCGFACYELSPLVRGTLLSILEQLEEGLRPLAASLLAQAALADDAEVASALVSLAERPQPPAVTGGVLAALGRCGHRNAGVYLGDQLQVRHHPEEVLGLLEAVDVRSETLSMDAVLRLAAGKDVRVRASAARLLWSHGRRESIDLLLGLLRDHSGPEALAAALGSLDEMSAAGLSLFDLPRFEGLSQLGRENLKTAAYQEFAASALSLRIPRETIARAFDAELPGGDRASWREEDREELLALVTRPARESAPAGAQVRKAQTSTPRYAPSFATAGLDAAVPAARGGAMVAAVARVAFGLLLALAVCCGAVWLLLGR